MTKHYASLVTTNTIETLNGEQVIARLEPVVRT